MLLDIRKAPKIFDNSTAQKKPEEKLKNEPPTKKPSATQNAPATRPATDAEDQIRYLHDQISPMLQYWSTCDNMYSKMSWKLLVK